MPVVFHEVDFDIVAVVPNEELLTKITRCLPTEISFKQAVTAGAVGNVLVALLNGIYIAGKMRKMTDTISLIVGSQLIWQH